MSTDPYFSPCLSDLPMEDFEKRNIFTVTIKLLVWKHYVGDTSVIREPNTQNFYKFPDHKNDIRR